MKKAAYALVLLLLAAGSSLTGCEGGSDSPGSHTLLLGGAFHLEGHTDPLSHCTQCHGAALKGGSGPSCFSCHSSGDTW